MVSQARKNAYKVFKDDGEMSDSPHLYDEGIDKLKFYLKHVKKSGWYCPLCGSKVLFGVSEEAPKQPEWSYFCNKCKKVFIIVMEDRSYLLK